MCYKHEEARSLAWRTFWGSFVFRGPSENPVLVHSGCCKATPQPELLRRGSGAWSLRSEGQRAQGGVRFRPAGLSCPHMVQGRRSSVGLPVCVCVCVCVSVSQWCRTLCGPIDCSLPGSCVHGVLQARILEWLLFASPGALPDPRVKSRSPVSQADSLALSHQQSGAFLMRALIPFVRALPSGPNHSKVPPPYTVTLDMRFSTYEFCGGCKHTDHGKPYLPLFSQPMDVLVKAGLEGPLHWQ